MDERDAGAVTDHAFYDSLAAEMLGRLRRLRSFTGDRASIGYCHGEILRETIRSMLSPRFQMRRGVSFAAKGRVSGQGDILIVDEMDPAPYLFRQADFVVVRPCALVCVIQVKTRLAKQSFAKAIDNLASFGSVAKEAAPSSFPATYVFAFSGSGFRQETLDGWYKHVRVPDGRHNYPMIVLSLQRGILRLRCDKSTGQFGHHRIEGEEGRWERAKGLAMFLSSIRVQVERCASIASNPYAQAPLERLLCSPYCLRYGKGVMRTPRGND